ncbi:hypothetical protein CDL15_Pgr022615 [Punica granatum]|nr:hypothetical protein CDL15_Pgr022615 [Punica granatum]
MVIQALNKITVDSYDDDGDNTIWRIRIVLKRRRNTDGSGWEGILKGAFNIATDVAGIGIRINPDLDRPDLINTLIGWKWICYRQFELCGKILYRLD